jgi:hypothetical protein
MKMLNTLILGSEVNKKNKILKRNTRFLGQTGFNIVYLFNFTHALIKGYVKDQLNKMWM